MTTFYWQGRKRGWIIHKNGVWRALTPSGAITHHTTSLAALEALLCSE